MEYIVEKEELLIRNTHREHMYIIEEKKINRVFFG